VADASSAERAFDILFSRFGVMFFDIRQRRSPICAARAQAGRVGRFRLLA
jgi:hypothetical protein